MFARSRVQLFVALAVLMGMALGACTPAAPAAPTAVPAEPTAVAAAPTVAEPTEPAAEALKIAFVFPGLINEGAFNELGYAALEQAKTELGADVSYVESVADPDAPKILRDYASKGFDIVVAWSGAYPPAVVSVAPDFPQTSFVTLSDPGDYPDNVWLVGTDFEDAYFLAGAAAAAASKTGKVGHVLAIPIPVYAAGAKAYAEGVKYYNPDAQVYEAFIGDFNDAVKAKQTTMAQMEQGADVILSSLDLGILGIIEAAKDDPATRVMGIMLDPEKVAGESYMGSILQDYPAALVGIFKEIAAGKPGGFQSMNLASDLGDFTFDETTVSAEALEKLAEIRAGLEAGEIKYTTPADLPQQ